MLHDNPQRVVATDKWFVLGGNPDGNGGGVIATRNVLKDAQALAEEAIKEGYTHVSVQTWEQMFEFASETNSTERV